MVSKETELDAFVFSMVIKACSNLEQLNLGSQLHDLMIKKGFGEGCVLKAISSLHEMDYGRHVHGYIVRTGLVSNNYVMCSLLDMYIECIEHESSEQWKKVPLKVYVGLERGKVFHSLARKLDVHSDPYVTSALIDMYSKYGVPEAASRVFERVEDPGTVRWSALISGLSWNGWFVEALTCLQKMQLNGIEANEFTSTSVILASVALEANSVFELMPEKSSLSWTSIISAKVEHEYPSEALTLFNDMRRRNK
ncbi:hypothetical protein F3Y22_tig00111587pilonHSYRG00095 [Hibiscus syriacus]|uniref:Pentatricopeptide repeat-containing protein n=1 Tax=Hibiscus syriacus TaxID=106335 RepID=A0A6A2YD68_HIBSY|nr:hypothetical protein F3Y22_tig00111587pilonHSYRG00095 [Hibiscus syriacus]